MNQNKFTIKQLTLVGLMAAMVFIASAFLQFPIATVVGNTRLHMGNVMCLLAGFLLGPLYGGLAAGIGSAFFDLTNPAYIASTPFTFAFKFLMAFVCGMLYYKLRANKNKVLYRAIAGAAGAFVYVALYLAKSFLEARFVLQVSLEGALVMLAQKGAVSAVNAAIAVIMAVPVSSVIEPLLEKQREFQ